MVQNHFRNAAQTGLKGVLGPVQNGGGMEVGEVDLLGPFRVVRDGEVLPLGGPRQRAVLAALAINANSSVSRDSLIGLVWGENPPASVTGVLQTYIANIRKALEPSGAPYRVLISQAAGYELRLPSEAIDIHRFEAGVHLGREAMAAGEPARAEVLFSDALALWRGPALGEFAVEPFALGTARRLEELRLTVMEDRIDARLALGRHHELVPELDSLVDQHPLRERLGGQLMLALYRDGRQAESSDVYQRIRKTLEEEAGLSPGPELQRLLARILKQDPNLAVYNRSAGPTPRSNLPAQLTSFVGRRNDLSILTRLAEESRLITLVGAGGVGKSRLATQFAQALEPDYSDGIWWVDLTPIEDSQQVAPAISTCLGLRNTVDVSKDIVSFLKGKHALVVLDNCEHVVDGCAEAARHILEQCAELTVIATSREPLGVRGEAQWRVGPMDLADALELFERRARLVHPGFEIAGSNATHVAQICRRVDELPLAIELAASRLGVMSEEEISRQLARSLHLLSDGPRSDIKRHQTMNAAIEWSYSQLAESEKALFRRLAVFRGGFSIDSATAVCLDARVPDVVSTLARLVNKSMVAAYRLQDDRMRYRLLELQAAFAEERIRTTAAEWGLAQRRHYDHFREGLSARTRKLVGRTGKPGVSLSDEQWKQNELGNLWAAFRWAQSNSDDLGLDMAPDILLVDVADISASRRLLNELLARQSMADVSTRLWALEVSGQFAFEQGDAKEVERLANAFYELAEREHAPERLAEALMLVGGAHEVWGRLEAAETAFRQGLSFARTTSNLRLTANLQNELGMLLVSCGQNEAGRQELLECVNVLKSVDDAWMLAGFMDSLAMAELACGDHRAAERTWVEAVSLSGQMGDFRLAILCLAGLACTASALGDNVRGLHLAAAHQQLADQWSVKLDDVVREWFDRSQATSSKEIGEKEAVEAKTTGAAMSLERAIQYAQEVNVGGLV